MITAKYPDEPDPITYASEHEQALYEAIKQSTGLTVREICAMAGAIILSEIDPIDATAEPAFDWPQAPLGSQPDFCWFSPEVPDPLANVNVVEAFRKAQRDAQACKLTLEFDSSTEAAVRVLRNTIGWLRFWQIRARSPELRGWFSEQLADRLDGLTRLRERAFSIGSDEVLTALTEL
jgi:hypothetical protein